MVKVFLFILLVVNALPFSALARDDNSSQNVGVSKNNVVDGVNYNPVIQALIEENNRLLKFTPNSVSKVLIFPV